MAKSATNQELKQAFELHLEQTRARSSGSSRCSSSSTCPSRRRCEAMEGLLEEARSTMEDIEDQSVLDVGMIINAQKVEHYEIAGYGSLVALAKQLGHNDAAQLLEQTLNEEEGDRPEAEPGGAQRRQPFDLLRRPGRQQAA